MELWNRVVRVDTLQWGYGCGQTMVGVDKLQWVVECVDLPKPTMACTGALGRLVDDMVITDMVYVTPLVRPVRV